MSKNPFDDDYEDYTGATATRPVKKYTTVTSTPEDDINYYEKEMERYMQESLDSTERSRKQLEQSEQIGVATAQDLLAQREKLENAERNLDEIERTTRMTQRNLNSLKSFFGGFFKNKFSRSSKEPTPVSSSASESKLNKTIGNLDSKPYTGGAISQSGPSLSESSRAAIKGTRWEAMDNEIDANLDSMSAQLARLNELGRAIGTEVDSQNEMLDRIQMKTERNEARVRDQDTQMKRLLGNVEKQDDKSSVIPSVNKGKLSFWF
ncbi:unnamed protein product [Enterobius vermicularis]|uniref:t-SNARE coiled-coil homology domain-containing protein n=1 Tax=Enterobius vermicularis TaxID=51028 RepID=A0A0N4VCX5_ENTVE|nr:unnamed protein product [Enterobius vermicularis]